MNMSIRVDTSGALLKGQGPEVIARNVEAFIVDATMYLVGQIKERTPYKTGNLERSVLPDFQGKGTPVVKGIVASAQPYALPVETGTGVYGPKGVPYVVKTKNGKQFTVQGMKGAHMFKKGLTENEAFLATLAQKYGLKIAMELGQ